MPRVVALVAKEILFRYMLKGLQQCHPGSKLHEYLLGILQAEHVRVRISALPQPEKNAMSP